MLNRLWGEEAAQKWESHKYRRKPLHPSSALSLSEPLYFYHKLPHRIECYTYKNKVAACHILLDRVYTKTKSQHCRNYQTLARSLKNAAISWSGMICFTATRNPASTPWNPDMGAYLHSNPPVTLRKRCQRAHDMANSLTHATLVINNTKSQVNLVLFFPRH